MTTKPPFAADLVRVAAIRDYLLTHGWVERPCARPEGLHFEHTTRKFDAGYPMYMIVPAFESLDDYAYHAERVVRTLSQIEKRPEADVFHDLTTEPRPSE